jgi:hypothetical protein
MPHWDKPWTYPEKINIHQQIGELKRERALRSGVYTKMVSSGSLKHSAADLQMGTLDACIATLEYMRDYRPVILAAVTEYRETTTPAAEVDA